MAVGRTKKITRKQAESYERSVPNGMGVTAIASVNGRGAYARKYAQTRAILKNGKARAASSSSRIDALRALAKKKLEHLKSAASKSSKRMARVASKRVMALVSPKPSRRSAPAQKQLSLSGAVSPGLRNKSRVVARKTSSKKATIQPDLFASRANVKAPKAARKTTKKVAGRKHSAGKYEENMKKKSHRAKKPAHKAARKAHRKVARKSFARTVTYRFRPNTSGVSAAREAALRALAAKKGAESSVAASAEKVAQAAKTVAASAEKVAKAAKVSRKSARKASSEVRKAKRKYTRRTPEERAAAAARPKRKYTRRSPEARAAHKAAKSKKSKHYARGVVSKLYKKIARRMKKYTPTKPTISRKEALHELMLSAKYFRNGRRVRHYEENRRAHHYEENKKAHRRGRKHASMRRYEENRRHARKHSFRRNGYLENLKQALMTGGIAAVGFLAHRALTHAVDTYVAAKVFENTPKLAPYRRLISAAAVAAVGVPATQLAGKYLSGSQKSTIQAGMIVSLAQTAIVDLLGIGAASEDKKLAENMSNVRGYFAAYPESYRGYGEYFATNGVGEYFATNGLGAYTQAAAGMGQITQAAAGMGQITQAAAGYSQAAAGVGEYFATGTQGVGEYFATNGFGEYTQAAAGMGMMDEGIMPDTNSAEYALSVAEATAGVGDAEAISTVNPSDMALPISDNTEGLRTGILEGGDGIFG